jgi:hypothetical protein
MPPPKWNSTTWARTDYPARLTLVLGSPRAHPVALVCLLGALAAPAWSSPQVDEPDSAGSKFRSAEDGAFDVSGFLDEEYGFVPLVIPITEPAVGYGAAGGLVFIDKPLRGSRAGFARPNVTMAGGLVTENGTNGLAAGDLRHWRGERLQTLIFVLDAAVNLDFFGIGESAALAGQHLRYKLEPTGGAAQARYRLGGSRTWAGLGYAFAATRVTFDVPAGTPGLPAFNENTNVGGLTPSLSFDSRDNIFTPLRGAYAEIVAGLFGAAFGGDDEFQRVRAVAIQYLPLNPTLTLGLRGEAAACFGAAPFYLRPYVALRGAPIMRYQGEEMALIESELRWQLWKRWSAVGFAGLGAAWNGFERVENSHSVVTGGAGFRYEMAREYGIHSGVDLAFGPDGTAIYIQFGSAWARP